MTKKSSTPAIRLKGFTDTWEQRKFEEIAVRSSVICSDDTLPRVEYEDIVSGTGRLNKDIYAKQSSKSGIAFHQGDVLYGKLRPYLQNWLLPTFDGLAVGDFWVLQPQNADSSFLYRLIQSRQFDEVANQSTGTKMPRADWKLVSKTVFSIPSNISEQAAIGTYFTALDSLITLHQRKCANLCSPSQVVFSLLFATSTFSWEQRKLGDVVKEITRNDPGSEAPIMMITANNGFIEQSERYAFNNAGESLKKYILLKKGELAYNHGASKLRPYGSCFALTTAENARIPFVYHCFSAENQNAEFMSIELNGAEIENQLRKIVSSGARMDGLLNISFDEYTSVSVILPGTEEQDRIADFFRHLDNLITLHQRQHFLHSTPDISLSVRLIHPFYTSSWEQRKLGEIGSVSMCRRIFKEQTSETGDIPFYKIGTFGADPDAFISRELFEEYKSKYPYPQKGDILISASGSIGRTVEFAGNNEYFQDSNIVWLNHDERLSNPFLKCFYSVVKWAGIEGSTIKRLYNDNILNTVICMPSVSEQKRIGLFFENLDNLITLHQRKGKAAVSGCSNDANNSKGVCCKARDFGYKCHKKDEPNRFDA